MSRPRVLYVDDDAGIRKAFARALASTFDITEAADGAEAMRLLEQNAYDAILTDLTMPNVGGDKLVEWLKVHQPSVAGRVVVLSGGSTDAKQASWFEAFDPQRRLSKPCDVPTIVSAIRVAIGRAPDQL